MPANGTRLKPLTRLANGAQFRAVLARGERRSSANFAIRVMPNELTVPRLGTIAARKVAKRAVDRNRGRRLVREWFRLQQDQLAPLDIVVQFRTDLRNSSSAALRAELGKLMNRLGAAGANRTTEQPSIRPDLE
jgi:ribonuclease P protein component